MFCDIFRKTIYTKTKTSNNYLKKFYFWKFIAIKKRTLKHEKMNIFKNKMNSIEQS